VPTRLQILARLVYLNFYSATNMTPLFAEIIAIGSAMGWAGDSVFVRFGLRRSNIFAAMLVSYTVSITCMWTYFIATTSLEFIKSPAMIYYLISGCMQPLFATAIAVTVFHEQPSWLVFLGTVLIVGSLWLISGKQQGDAKWRLVDALLPIGAGLISAVSQSLRKQALKIIPDPFVAVAVVTTVSLILLLLFAFTTHRTAQFRIQPQSLIFFICAASLAALAQVANFVALGHVQLSVNHTAAQHHAAV
jgi:drug/metabolite transporter (DMT)-like permease